MLTETKWHFGFVCLRIYLFMLIVLKHFLISFLRTAPWRALSVQVLPETLKKPLTFLCPTNTIFTERIPERNVRECWHFTVTWSEEKSRAEPGEPLWCIYFLLKSLPTLKLDNRASKTYMPVYCARAACVLLRKCIYVSLFALCWFHHGIHATDEGVLWGVFLFFWSVMRVCDVDDCTLMIHFAMIIVCAISAILRKTTEKAYPSVSIFRHS